LPTLTGVSRPTVFNYLDLFLHGGIEALLRRRYRGGKKATLHAGLQAQLVEEAAASEVSPGQGYPAVGCARKTGKELA